ncbi:MAG TPA: lysophospholipid acyltransferase family protein [Acidobacteriaceae bacterium]|nr:lysophospholipid acyltransferase family protein [Acidobacteriaceae bacterium]
MTPDPQNTSPDPRNADPQSPPGLPANTRAPQASAREWLEFLLLRLLVGSIGILPRPLARAAGASIGAAAWLLLPRLRRVGLRNLELALPLRPPAGRDRILRRLYTLLGWHLAEFCRLPRITRANAEHLFRYDGLDHYLAARAKGRGVLVLTGHLGAWELSSFFHSLMGYPMGMVIRRLDNPLVDAFVNRIRCLHGNRVLHKDDFARGLLQSMHRGETVGILMDTNMTPPQGVFVPFFGVPACTASGLARIAAHSQAAVLPGFLLWEPAENMYILHFGPELTLQHTADPAADALANTALFTSTLESWIRRYPEQWLWVHRRWKTRPPGEPSLYP